MLVLAMSLILSLNVSGIYLPKSGNGISPHYKFIHSLMADLTISTTGKATCTANAKTEPNYTVEIVCELRNSNGATLKSWSDSNTWYASAGGSWYVKSGSQYQVVATATIYDADGNYVDSGTTYSRNVSY